MINPLIKYKAYHQDKINIVIHQACIPLLLMSFYSLVPIYLAFIVNTFYSVNYLLFDVFSRKSVYSVYYLHLLFFLHFAVVYFFKFMNKPARWFFLIDVFR